MFIRGQPCTSQHMPPRRCSPHPVTLGHAGLQTPGSPLRVPVGIFVNRGDPRALAQRGLELALGHRGSVAISGAHPESFGKGNGGRPRNAPHAGLPFPLARPKHGLSFTLGSSVLSPPSCYFKHANLGDHLSAPKFSEKIKACKPAGSFLPAALREAALPAALQGRAGACQEPALQAASSLVSMAARDSTC